MKFYRLFLALPALCISAAAADETGSHVLRVEAGTPEVSVKPQAPGRRSLSLPSLDYVFSIEAQCPDEWTPASLSLNIADSRIAKTGEDLEDQANQQLDITVPARQLAPLALRDFCVIDAADEGSATATEMAAFPGQATVSDRLEINAALAHASLRCTRDDEQRIVYVSQPLDVALICEANEAEGGATAR
jgi:hypothetical protein